MRHGLSPPITHVEGTPVADSRKTKSTMNQDTRPCAQPMLSVSISKVTSPPFALTASASRRKSKKSLPEARMRACSFRR